MAATRVRIVRLTGTALLAMTSLVAGSAQSAGEGKGGVPPELQAFVTRLERAAIDMFHGDAASWKELLSESDQATIFPPFGGFVSGREATRGRYESVAARGASTDVQFEVEVLAFGVSGDLAYIVAFERSRFRPAGAEAVRSGFTRVTHILHREGGEWRLLHRHMDHLPEAPEPG